MTSVGVHYHIPALNMRFYTAIAVRAGPPMLEQVKAAIIAKLQKQLGDVAHTFVIETITTTVGYMKSVLAVNEYVSIVEEP